MEISASLFAAKGFDNVSLREIAGLSEIKESSIYNHFNGKDEIRNSLFKLFAEAAESSRPSEAELEELMQIMGPEEIFKHIVFQVGKQIDEIMENIAMFIHYEKYRNPIAAEVYEKNMVIGPVNYYQWLIEKMTEKGVIKPVDARTYAEQYNYVSLTLTQEYFMSRNNLKSKEAVVRKMISALMFFCGLMKKD